MVVTISNMQRQYFVLALSLFAVFGCAPSGERRIALGSQCYLIPSKNVLKTDFVNDADTSSFDRSIGSAHLVFSGDFVSEHVPSFTAKVSGVSSTVKDDLTVIVSSLTDANLEYILSGEHYTDLWNASNSYSTERLGREIVWDQKAQLFRVYRQKIGNSWVFVDIDPNDSLDELPSSNHVVGNCHDTIRMGIESYNCTHSFLSGGLNIEYRLPMENFALYKQVDSFVLDQLENWKFSEFSNGSCKKTDLDASGI